MLEIQLRFLRLESTFTSSSRMSFINRANDYSTMFLSNFFELKSCLFVLVTLLDQSSNFPIRYVPKLFTERPNKFQQNH